jgi:hypothetical protein
LSVYTESGAKKLRKGGGGVCARVVLMFHSIAFHALATDRKKRARPCVRVRERERKLLYANEMTLESKIARRRRLLLKK